MVSILLVVKMVKEYLFHLYWLVDQLIQVDNYIVVIKYWLLMVWI